MIRIQELIAAIQARFPHDAFFANFNERLILVPLMAEHYESYNRALLSLDPISWDILKAKALDHYEDHREGQLKQGLFNQLNEAFAYEYLTQQGCTQVQILQEDTAKKKSRTPDLRYWRNGSYSFCEVKTISLSDEEIGRRSVDGYHDRSGDNELGAGFLNKLSADMRDASAQISGHGTGLVFVHVNFDDFTMTYWENYKSQLLTFFGGDIPNNLVIKIGIVGSRILQGRSCIFAD